MYSPAWKENQRKQSNDKLLNKTLTKLILKTYIRGQGKAAQAEENTKNGRQRRLVSNQTGEFVLDRGQDGFHLSDRTSDAQRKQHDEKQKGPQLRKQS